MNDYDYNPYYDCPICGSRKLGEDRMGHHLVAEHWEMIVEAFGDGDGQ